jgi:hypothetical protein
MRPGDTFTLRDKSVDSHLWAIVSDPALDGERVLFVSMTSYDVTKEKVCLLDVGDHPFVKHKTCVAYDFAKVAPLEALVVLRDQGHLSMGHPVSAELLERIRQGISLSRRINVEHVTLMIDQGLLD